MAQKTRRVSHGVAVSTLFSAIALLYGTAAYGGFYPGHIDPGGNGTDIPGFNGDVVFNIPGGCLPGGSFTGWLATTNNIGSGGCGAATVYSATIDLYSVLTTDPPNPGVVLGQFSLAEINFWDILGVYSLNGALAGIDTNAMGSEPGTAVAGHTDWVGHDFWLQFVSDHCPVEGGGCTPPGQFFSDPAFISVDNINNFSAPGFVTFGTACNDPNDCRVAAAPEPGTLGLILGALGGGWLARRRKGKAAA